MTETEIYFNFLLHVAAADEILEDAEIEFLESSLLAVGASNDITQSIMKKIDQVKNNEPLEGFEQIINSLKTSSNPSLVMTLVRDGYMLAVSDGEAHDSEIAIIKKMFMSFDASSEKLFERAIRWAQKSLAIKESGEEIYRALNSSEG